MAGLKNFFSFLFYGYVFLVILNFLIVWVGILEPSEGSALMGVGLIVLGLPWTMMAFSIIDTLFAKSDDALWLTMLVVSLSSLINGWILFKLKSVKN